MVSQRSGWVLRGAGGQADRDSTTDRDDAYVVADLDAGDHIAVCSIPVGTTTLEGAPPEGPPHFTQGMVQELSVS